MNLRVKTKSNSIVKAATILILPKFVTKRAHAVTRFRSRGAHRRLPVGIVLANVLVGFDLIDGALASNARGVLFFRFLLLGEFARLLLFRQGHVGERGSGARVGDYRGRDAFVRRGNLRQLRLEIGGWLGAAQEGFSVFLDGGKADNLQIARDGWMRRGQTLDFGISEAQLAVFRVVLAQVLENRRQKFESLAFRGGGEIHVVLERAQSGAAAPNCDAHYGLAVGCGRLEVIAQDQSRRKNRRATGGVRSDT